jgi:hypothetical protein
VEFINNNNYQATIVMTPFKALNERKYHTSWCRDEVGEIKLLGLLVAQPIVVLVILVIKLLI